MANTSSGKKSSKKHAPSTVGLPKAPRIDVQNAKEQTTFRNKVTMPDADDYWPGAFMSLVRSAAGAWQNIIPLLGIVIIYGLVSSAEAPKNLNYVDLLVFTYRQALLTVVLLASVWPVYALAVADRQNLTVAAWLKASSRRYLPALLVTIGTVLVIMLSSFLFFLPLIWLGPWICMAAFVAVDSSRKDVGVLEAFRESYRLTRHYKILVWYIFGALILAVLLLGLLFTPLTYYFHSPAVPAFTKAVTSVVTILSSCSLAMLYRWLQRMVPAED